MLPDFSDIFAEYELLRAEADALFARLSQLYPHCVACKPGCADCCHALFDLSLVEAMYVNDRFMKAFSHGLRRSRILEKASEIDRKLTRQKRELYRSEKAGESAGKIMETVAGMRMACPLLDTDNRCQLYENRPITCRLYGIPLEIGGQSHVCGISRFEKGQDYPTVKLGKIQARLENLSGKIAERSGSRFDLNDVYVPLSMALLTKYDDKYLGVGEARD